jgi:AcrR family transcriptional regulator
MGGRGATRDRILEEALRLFAEKGFREVTVGAIEAAAGLAPRRGGFYRHFASKEAVLEETVERHARELEGLPGGAAGPPGGDPGARLRRLAARGLAFLRGQGPLLRVLARDGDRFPALRRRVLRRLVDPGYLLARREFGRLRPAARPREVRGVAAVALGALVHFVEDEQAFGVPPARASEAAFVDAWVALLLAWSCRPARRRGR